MRNRALLTSAEKDILDGRKIERIWESDGGAEVYCPSSVPTE